MATHFSILAGEMPWTGKPGSLQFMGSQRVEHDLAAGYAGHSASIMADIKKNETAGVGKDVGEIFLALLVGTEKHYHHFGKPSCQFPIKLNIHLTY